MGKNIENTRAEGTPAKLREEDHMQLAVSHMVCTLAACTGKTCTDEEKVDAVIASTEKRCTDKELEMMAELVELVKWHFEKMREIRREERR